MSGIGDDWRDSKDSGAESVGYRAPLEGLRILWLNLSGIGDDWRDSRDSEPESVKYGRRLDGFQGFWG